MRTAQDVLNRVCWDASLDADEFSVVYLDRFVGAVTVPLRQFQVTRAKTKRKMTNKKTMIHSDWALVGLVVEFCN